MCAFPNVAGTLIDVTEYNAVFRFLSPKHCDAHSDEALYCLTNSVQFQVRMTVNVHQSGVFPKSLIDNQMSLY